MTRAQPTQVRAVGWGGERRWKAYVEDVPVILTQHYSPADRVYEDVEYALYHYPRQYFSRVVPYDRFIYYRPLGRSARRNDSKTYFGHGVLGQWFPDASRDDHRYVPLIQAEHFLHLVPLHDKAENFYETESTLAPQFQSAVREISETAYWKILASANVMAMAIPMLPSTEAISRAPYAATAAPLDELRATNSIPPGAGYKPRGDNRPNVYESAALQERARADHQDVLRLLQQRVLELGGSTWYNNNIDLYARIGERRLLIEAKSLVDARAAVDRMRYGIGQLADYDYRYRAKLEGPEKVLAFGALPSPESTWIRHVLEDQRIAFIASADGRLIAMNDAAEALPIF
ncbi:MAG TPA: hypothetical protein VIN40_03360 [Candidatus Tyrphobacter sp.]